MSKVLELKKNPDDSVREVLKYLLESDKIHGVFSLKKVEGNNNAIAYSLITKPDEIDKTVPLFPLMPVNAANLLSQFTFKGPTPKPVAAVVKPCELRAFVELAKRQKGYLDNIFIISPTCGGVYSSKMVADPNSGIKSDEDLDKLQAKLWDAIKKYDTPEEIRPTCSSCEQFIPYNADITVGLVGNNNLDQECKLYINTPKAEEVLAGFEGKVSDQDQDITTDKLENFRKKREEYKNNRYSELKLDDIGLEGLVNLFGKCIGCKGCRAVCPICYCQVCTFDSQNSNYKPTTWENDLKRKGGIRVPPNTIYYHILRVTHMGISCVACGACEDVCPVNIPVSTIFKMVGESIQVKFEYVSGKNPEDDIPLKIFALDELTEVED
jgi:formate dehydrogenase subunit beta